MLRKWLGALLSWNRAPVVVVSGLPRSGTSLLMQMLTAGGLEPFSDAVREADDDNPRGYFEHERVKELKGDPDKAWVKSAGGRVIKVISHLLPELPSGLRYQVIFLRRNLDEIIASQNRMLERRGEPLAQDDGKTRELFETHLERISNWLRCQPNFQVVEIEYAEIIASPMGAAERLRNFLGMELDLNRMAGAVDPALYRNRRGG